MTLFTIDITLIATWSFLGIAYFWRSISLDGTEGDFNHAMTFICVLFILSSVDRIGEIRREELVDKALASIIDHQLHYSEGIYPPKSVEELRSDLDKVIGDKE